MLNCLRIIVPLFYLFFGLCEFLQAQKIDLNDYKNKAQAYAILSAQYSSDAYFCSRKNYFLVSTKSIKLNCDTGIVNAQLAIEYADSALLVANDSSLNAKEIMLTAKHYQQKAIEKFEQIGKENNANVIHDLSKKSMYAMGNAVTDAYKASLAFDWKGSDEEPISKKGNRELTRLESDEFSYITIKELYGKRLTEIEKELELLEVEAKKSDGKELEDINNAISQLKVEEKDLISKVKNSEDKLIGVKNELNEEMLKVVNKDIFTTEKKDFYNKNVPVPVDAKIPEGLVYRVQIGFFKSQLPPQHFKGIFPISSEKIDKVYYRYVAGNFKKYADAKDAKIAIREQGYSDSFIISYYNGEKISINEALKKEKETN